MTRPKNLAQAVANAYGMHRDAAAAIGREQVAIGLAYQRWRGRLPPEWRTSTNDMGVSHRFGAVQVLATIEPMDPDVPEGEQYVVVSVSRSDQKLPSPADVALAQAVFLPAEVPIEEKRGGERVLLVYLSAILPVGMAWAPTN